MKNAIISVSDKTNLVFLARELHNLGYKIYSTGGTAKMLKENKIDSVEIAEYTGFPEILDGRVKTLHPKIYGGILAKRNNQSHINEIKNLNIISFDIVVVNLYPFEKTISKTDNEEEIIENIDIGGVTLIRASAKNFQDVLVVVDSKDYEIVIQKIKQDAVDINFRKYLATKAFMHTARYDSLISKWFLKSTKANIFDYEEFSIEMRKISNLRYGENPHQQAALYAQAKFTNSVFTLVDAEKLQGKELSYNNYLDLDSAINIIRNFQQPACVIIKHNNPCGVAEANTLLDAYKRAYSCDPVSAFGGIISFNYEVDAATAEEVTKIFTECIIAPNYTEKAKQIFSKKKDLRLLQLPNILSTEIENIEVRQIDGGFLVQTKDDILGVENLKFVTKRQPTEQELKSLIFAYKVAKYVKSNTIVLAKGTQTVGIGAGQMSRIDALKIASIKMNQIQPEVLNELSNLPLVLASDAFFPFRDVVDEAAKIGVKAIIQPGGSLRDEDSIKAANEYNIAMVFTGVRHFRH
ncbi:MAG: bifunctional phosphoribosylaminoimidazolecarboxamide formyltransferase/IMP cyclohydrolase [Endomicrobia bacterium]|nr:bifunctional phosphoribosylaminoimidazolecarboxamide formyltransferase/IMP cyclohydrolase [Endomicrobiia bacterium]MDW8055382.1 bifunctional phosphoribosylaminoimidazolecarboxamide formyltransferase/IMP cyclohydrolase [Elusimicrobiota bacterium]